MVLLGEELAHEAVDAAAGRHGWEIAENRKDMHLVWCFEHCHKAESEGQRNRMRGLALDAGASLLLFKKAKQFSAWKQETFDGAPCGTWTPRAAGLRPLPLPYVLLASWREAKQCLQASTKENRPVLMVVCCDTARGFGHALEWASGLESLEWGRVCVTESWDAALDIAIRQICNFRSGQEEAQPQAQRSPPQRISLEPEGEACIDFRAGASLTHPGNAISPSLPLCYLLWRSDGRTGRQLELLAV